MTLHLTEAAAACRKISDRLMKTVKGLTIGELFHEQMKLKPNEILILAVRVNKQAMPFEDEQRLKCHICEESLCQGNVLSYPVTLSRANGSTFECVISTCSDDFCRQRLVMKLETEGP